MRGLQCYLAVSGGADLRLVLLGGSLLLLAVPTNAFRELKLSGGGQFRVITAATLVGALLVFTYRMDGNVPQYGLAIALAALAVQATRRE